MGSMTGPGHGRTWRPTGAMRVAFVALLCGTVALGCAVGPAGDRAVVMPDRDDGSELVIFLARHAEAHHAPGGDPMLTADGLVRAARLASVLRDAGIDVIHSSGYRRTDQTASPLATALGLEPVLYDARDLPALAERLKGSTGRHVVVGHSNTTPDVVRLLGGDPGADIHEAEHDRLYVLTVEPTRVRTVLLRY